MTRLVSCVQQQKSGIYYFRIAVPLRLRKTIGKREIKRSLRTKIKQDAIFQSMPLKLLINKFFIHLDNNTSNHISRETLELYDMMGFKLDKFKIKKNGEITIEGLEMDPKNVEAETKAFEKVIESAQILGNNQIVEHNCTTQTECQSLTSIIDTYISEKIREQSWTSKTENENRSSYNLLVQIIGDIDIRNIDHSHSSMFKDTLMKLPVRINTNPQYRDKSISAILDMKPTDLLEINT
ncbi:MAG: hypothetical protein HKP12_01810, partial [Gammaproteobacteria bacterium]|nr:hypothetical protein [Gammaproteobacteria bacterium]